MSIFRVRVKRTQSAWVYVVADSEPAAERLAEALADDFETDATVAIARVCEQTPDERWWAGGRWHYPERAS